VPSPGTPPQILGLRLAKSRVRAGAPVTALVKLSAAGKVDIKVYRMVRRHRHSRAVLVGLLSEEGKRGSNTFVIRQVHHHRLAAGSYKLSVYTVAGKTTSKRRTVTLTLTR
jgi:hypothetical protein